VSQIKIVDHAKEQQPMLVFEGAKEMQLAVGQGLNPGKELS
jgi:hypothetical protein